MSTTSRGVTSSSALDPGEAGEVADVRQAGEQQPVEVRRREPVDQRGEPRAGADRSRRALARAQRRDEAAQRELVARARPARTTTPTRRRTRAWSAGAPARARRRSSRAPRRTGRATPASASRSARLVCEYAPALTTAPSTRPRSACTMSISSPSPLRCAHSTSTPSSRADRGERAPRPPASVVRAVERRARACPAG